MNRAKRAEYRQELHELLARMADDGATPLEASKLFVSAMRERLAEGAKLVVFDAVDDVLNPERRARPRK